MTNAHTYTYEIDLATMLGGVTRARSGQKGVQEFLSTDPLTSSYPWYTPYQFAGNKPINSRDLDGLEEIESISADGIANFYPVEIKAKRMTALEVNYYRRVRTAVGKGYSFASANKYAQIMQGGGPMARSLGMRMATNAPPIELTGNISINVATNGISSEFADNVAQASYDAISSVITLPLGGIGGQTASRGVGMLQVGRRVAGGFMSSRSVIKGGSMLRSTYQFLRGTEYFGQATGRLLSNPNNWMRGVSLAGNLNGQHIRNKGTGESGINVFEAGAALIAPRNFAFQGMASGIGLQLNLGADRGEEFTLKPSLSRAVKGTGIGVGMQSIANRFPGIGPVTMTLIGQTAKPAIGTMINGAQGALEGKTKP